MSEEKMRVLRMLEKGKIDAAQAEKLLEAIDGRNASAEIEHGKPRWLRIQVFEGGSKPKANIRIPLGLMKVAKKFIPKAARARMGETNIDIDEVLSAIDEGKVGKLIEVEDGEERVYVFVE